MNRIVLSSCGYFVEVWNNGNKATFFHVSGRLHETVAAAREYVRKWTGDESPEISRELQGKLDAIDAMYCRLAFAGEYR